MGNQPKPLSEAEIQEIAAMDDIRVMWGDDTAEEFAMRLAPGGDIYATHFDFMSGSPGYFGDMIILAGDGDPGEHITLVRRDGRLCRQ
jgi:hypothetical protein